MAKTQIGIGVLSIPGAFDKLGMIPGVITLFGLAAITTWSNHTIGAWKIKHPEVYGFDDAGRILFGSWGREIFSAVVLLCKCPHMDSWTSADRLYQTWFSPPHQHTFLSLPA